MSDFIRPPESDSELIRYRQENTRIINKHAKLVVPDDSTAANVAQLVADLNELLANLRTAFN